MSDTLLRAVDFDNGPTLSTAGLCDLMKALDTPPYHYLSEHGRETLALLTELHEQLPGGLEVVRELTLQKTLVNKYVRESNDPELEYLSWRYLARETEAFYPDMKKVEISGFRTYYYDVS